MFHFDAQSLQAQGACLFGVQGIQAFPCPAVQALVTVTALAGDPIEQFRIMHAFQRRQPQVWIGILRGDVGQCGFQVNPLQRRQPQFGLDRLLQ